MGLSPSDPWYVPPSDPRYKRALALSQMRRYIQSVERADLSVQRRRADAVADRRRCLAHWQAYLDGEITMRTGRRPVPLDARFRTKTITLPPLQIAAIEALEEDEEGFSATLQRVLDRDPVVAVTMEWVKKAQEQKEKDNAE